MPHKRSIKEKLLKGGAWAFAGKVVAVFAGLGINALLTRLLTPDEMGAYFLTFSLVAVAAIVAQLGLTQAIVRLVAESMGTDRPGRAKRSVLLVLRIVAFSGLAVACLLAFGAGQWISKQLFNSVIMSQVIGLAAVWAVIITLQSVMAEVYRGFHDIRLATVLGGLTTNVFSMGLFLVLWLIQGQSNLEQIITLTLGAGVSSVLLSSALLWKKLSRLPSEESDIAPADVLRISWPMWISQLTVFVLLQADLWIMGLFRPAEEVALYGVAARVVVLVAMPLIIVNSVVPPLISEMYAQGKIQELEKVLRSVSTLAGLPSLVIFSGFIFFGGNMLALFFGEYYQAGGAILAILSTGQLVNVWAGSCGLTLMLTGYQFSMMLITLFSGLFMIVGAVWSVNSYGGLGVACSAAAGMLIQNILMLLVVRYKTSLWTHADLRILPELTHILRELVYGKS